MVSRIEINTEMLGNTISDMSIGITQLYSHIKEIYEDIKELDNMWDGSANQVFYIQFEKDRAKLLNICGNLETYIDKMQYAKDEYNKCENAVAHIVDTIWI